MVKNTKTLILRKEPRPREPVESNSGINYAHHKILNKVYVPVPYRPRRNPGRDLEAKLTAFKVVLFESVNVSD